MNAATKQRLRATIDRHYDLDLGGRYATEKRFAVQNLDTVESMEDEGTPLNDALRACFTGALLAALYRTEV
jgi:hypothetical protein